MKIFRWTGWGINARVTFIGLLPVVLMFLAVVPYSYYARSIDVEQALHDRGRLIASLVAESSEYGVLSGNLGYLERTSRWLLQVDPSIYAIEITDQNKRRLFHLSGTNPVGANTRVFMAPIKRERLVGNTLDDETQPQISAALPESLFPNKPDDVIGYVQVTASPELMMAKQRERILLGSLIAGVALLISLALGYSLSMGLTIPLSKTIDAVRAIKRDEYRTPLVASATGEIGELQTAIADMAASLMQMRRDLEDKVLARTRDLEAARDEALRSSVEKKKLIQKVNEVIELERKNIAIDIHDHLNATLIVVRLEAQHILALLAKQAPTEMSEEVKERAEAIVEHSLRLYDMARNLVGRLRPEVIDTLGLRVAVDEMVRQFDTLHPHCRFELQATGDFVGLGDEIAIAAYRLIQEALSNIVKHASASKASVYMVFPSENNQLHIQIDDNGCGFDRHTIESGIGLIGMAERVDGLGGTLDIQSQPNAGTSILIDLPAKL